MMTPNDFDDALDFVLKREGGYVNDPADPGGETNMGISKRMYPQENIKGMTRTRAAEIYKQDYWLKFGCDKLSWPMSVMVFDTAVNMHPSVVVGLQKDSTDWMDFLMRRINQYAQLTLKRPKAAKFLAGWMIRVYHLYRFVRKSTEQKAQAST